MHGSLLAILPEARLGSGVSATSAPRSVRRAYSLTDFRAAQQRHIFGGGVSKALDPIVYISLLPAQWYETLINAVSAADLSEGFFYWGILANPPDKSELKSVAYCGCRIFQDPLRFAS